MKESKFQTFKVMNEIVPTYLYQLEMEVQEEILLPLLLNGQFKYEINHKMQVTKIISSQNNNSKRKILQTI